MPHSKEKKIYYLFLIFILGCTTGWIYEEIFYWITEGMLRNRGILYGPWLPIYGIGALGIYAMKPLKKKPFLLFILCCLITGIVEYTIGFVGVYILNIRLWDYRGLFLNIQGIICFRSVISFAILGEIFHYIIEPVLENLFNKCSLIKLRIICVSLLAIFIFDCIISALFRTPITY